MIYSGRSSRTQQPIRVHVENGRISQVEDDPQARADRWIAPGFIDLQVNGFAGVDYNSPQTSLEEIARSIEAQRATGVTRFCPTLITGSNDNIRRCLANLARAKRELSGASSIVGFHVEGPWISPLDGPRGAHPREHVRPPSIDEFEQFQDAAEGNIRLVTLAPEADRACAVIEHMVRQGVVVSIGHTNAEERHIQDAIRAGATMSTHLGNGAHQMMDRHANYIYSQLAADELSAGFIVDGIHLPPAFVKLAVRAKGLERSFLVTDAVAPAGCEPGRYHIGHLKVELTPDRRVQLPSGRLAGSALSMDRGVENLVHFAAISLYDALRAATVNPAKAIGLAHRRGFLEAGDAADLVFFQWDSGARRLNMENVIVAEPLDWTPDVDGH